MQIYIYVYIYILSSSLYIMHCCTVYVVSSDSSFRCRWTRSRRHKRFHYFTVCRDILGTIEGVGLDSDLVHERAQDFLMFVSRPLANLGFGLTRLKSWLALM